MSGLTAAIDVGTSLIKVVLIDDEGTEHGTASQRTRVTGATPGWSEQDMTGVLDAVLKGLREAVGLAGERVVRIALTAQGDGFWPVDRSGRPAGPAILWNDARSSAVVEEWRASGSLDEAFRINGSLGNSGLPHAILATLRREDEDRLAEVATVLTCGGWLYRALTGVLGLHPSDASAPWLDIATGTVSDELVDIYGLEWARELVPPVLAADELTAPLDPRIATAVGLALGTPVTMAPYDVVATGWGSGATAPGSAFGILGTTLCVGVQLDAADTSGPPSGLTLRNRDQPQPLRAFPTLAGTGVVDWAMTILQIEDAAELSALAAAAPSGSHGVRTWPYLSEAGERAPFLDPHARGVFAGITLSTTRADLARSVFEGLAHVIRDCVDATGSVPELLALSGGGSASSLWCQVIADTVGTTVTSEPGRQLGARGAHIAALAAERGLTPEAVAQAMPVQRTAFHPDPRDSETAAARHEDFLVSRDAFAERWRTWERPR
ncbi:FGGY family carbohydrate kinase [Curtobacterium sp. RRHDQ10]|uniref:FGGY family carbohydrate kinase n=1 Tax=Curtobacterium phyllosphaerae TaxID=3413379 RepID=UPI003BF1073B